MIHRKQPLTHNKYEMKKALTAAGVQTARFYCIHNEEELEAARRRLREMAEKLEQLEQNQK